MSLHIYRHEYEIPESILLVRDNDTFFDKNTELTDCPFIRDVLSNIDKAEYIDENHFLGRTKSLGNLDKSRLSTGTKTLINIYSNGDYCFDVSCCGNNALIFLPRITDGYILWEVPVVCYSLNDESCDILYRGKYYTNFLDFLNEVYMA